MNKKSYLIYAGFLVGLLALCTLLWYVPTMTIKNENLEKLPDSLDVLFDFYDAWLEESKVNGKVKTDSILLSSTALETGVRDSLIAKLNSGNDGVDPVLCQTVTPDNIKMKYVHELPTEVEVMVMSKYATGTPTGFALAKMKVVDTTWVITDITCSKGDVLDAREFSFSNKGQLLKNVPAPLDNTQWHLIFNENGNPGHAVPLRFGTSSVCITNGSESACTGANFKEAAYAEVNGSLTETGVDVATMRWSETAF